MAKSHYRDMYMRMPAYRVWPKGRYMYMKEPGRGIGNRHEARPVYEDPEGP